jgi:hypothetical protein
MTAGQLIAAVTANQGDREAACRIGQSRQQIQARLIRPLQVVEEHRHGAAASRGGQHRAHRRGHSRRAGLGRHGAELGHDLRENSLERLDRVADSRAQRAGHHLIGRTRPCGRPATQDLGGDGGENMLDQRGLAGSRLAGDQNHGHPPGPRDRKSATQRSALGLAPDKQPIHDHSLHPRRASR